MRTEVVRKVFRRQMTLKISPTRRVLLYSELCSNPRNVLLRRATDDVEIRYHTNEEASKAVIRQNT